MNKETKCQYQPEKSRGQDTPKEAELGNRTRLEIGESSIPWVETADFPITDPWSVHTRNVIRRVRSTGGFAGDFFEAGIGDARNVVLTGAHKHGRNITGVDLDGWRVNLAEQNLARVGIPQERLRLHQADVVAFLQDTRGEKTINGWGIACLPQAPGVETHNHADGIDSTLPSLAHVKDLKVSGHKADEVGLTLNAAFLDSLRVRVQKDKFNLLLTMSDRVPPNIKKDLFEKTGWEIVEEHRTEKPVQQDPDTGVAFVQNFDDGRRFFQKTETGFYLPISAKTAEARRAESEQNGGRDALNVHHHISVYHLRPGSTKIYGSSK